MTLQTLVKSLLGVMLFCLPLGASAVPIGLGSFGAGATTESFEGFVPGPAVAELINVGNPVFASGVQYVGTASSAGVQDLSIGPAGCFGSLVSAGQVPDGTSFVCGFVNTTSLVFSFLFPTGTFRVGVLTAVTDTNINTVFMEAYDAIGTLLETVSYTDIAGIGNWSSNFLGIEQAGGIARVDIYTSGSGLVLDALTFEVPEPSTLGLLGAGLIGIFMRRKRIA